MAGINDHEYRIFSQNGEDGIIDFLSLGLQSNHRRFIELGTSDGSENNTYYLLKKGWTGLGIDANEAHIRRYAQRVKDHKIGGRLTLGAGKVTWASCVATIEQYGERAPELFVLDIDGTDYYIAHRLLHYGFKPAIACCEYNAFLGERPLTVVYDEAFSRYRYDPERGLYFGASVGAWRHLFERFGYRFCGVDSAGVNAFFCRENAFRPGFLGGAVGLAHAYTEVFVRKYGVPGDRLQKELLARCELVFVDVVSEDVAAIAAARAGDSSVPQTATLEKAGSARNSGRPGTVPVIHAVTTFHAAGYEQFGEQFIDSFRKRWPADTRLWAMAEGCAPPPCEKIIVRDLMSDALDLVEFKRRHADNPGAHGRFGERYDYMLDAVRWSHRIFALREAAEHSDADILINIDADIICFDDVPLQFLASLMPEDADIGYMPRKGMYSECSFVLYRINRPLVQDFIAEHADYYVSDRIFSLVRWTDCHPFDKMVAERKARGELVFHNINEGIPDSMHPFINGPLGRYMDHLKGGRKEAGRSSDKDLVVQRKEHYWKKAQ
jgi:hypothetical protein